MKLDNPNKAFKPLVLTMETPEDVEIVHRALASLKTDLQDLDNFDANDKLLIIQQLLAQLR